MNDLFYFTREANLSNYADDNQLYFTDTDPPVVEHVLNKELVVVCEWFRNNCFSCENLMSSYHYFLKVLPYH